MPRGGVNRDRVRGGGRGKLGLFMSPRNGLPQALRSSPDPILQLGKQRPRRVRRLAPGIGQSVEDLWDWNPGPEPLAPRGLLMEKPPDGTLWELWGSGAEGGGRR